MLSKFVFTAAAFASVVRAGYETYPSVPHTATFNGLADPIYDKLPKCAQPCVTAVDPQAGVCPYWDTGCLCVMPNDNAASCIAASCKGKDVVSATSLAESLCTSAGANVWNYDSSYKQSLQDAAADTTEAEPSATTTPTQEATSDLVQPTSSAQGQSAPASSEPQATSSAAEESSSALGETSSAPEENSNAPEEASSVPAGSSGASESSAVESGQSTDETYTFSVEETVDASSSSANSASSESAWVVEQANLAPSKLPATILVSLSVCCVGAIAFL